MHYDMPLYRPPSEANSLIIQVTLGCSHNKCSFCSMYKSKTFMVKSLEQIKGEINFLKNNYGKVDRIFLADGDALIIPMDMLREIFKYLREVFTECSRISLYASPKSIELKTLDELIELKELGLGLAYMGIESGNDELLLEINKGADRNRLINAALKMKNSGIPISVTVIAGLGSYEKSEIHAKDTGDIISKINPNYVGVLSLMIEKNTEIYDNVHNGKFIPMDDKSVLKEISLLIKNINAKEKIIFRANHASNYISLKAELPNEKDNLIKSINEFIEKDYVKNYWRSL